MTRVFKYSFGQSNCETKIELPTPYRILSIHEQLGVVVMYVEVGDKDRATVKIRMFHTGEDIPSQWCEYLGTVLLHRGTYVLHVYRQKPDFDVLCPGCGGNGKQSIESPHNGDIEGWETCDFCKGKGRVASLSY